MWKKIYCFLPHFAELMIFILFLILTITYSFYFFYLPCVFVPSPEIKDVTLQSLEINAQDLQKAHDFWQKREETFKNLKVREYKDIFQ